MKILLIILLSVFAVACSSAANLKAPCTYNKRDACGTPVSMPLQQRNP